MHINIKANNLQIHCLTAGKGSPVLLLHGGGLNAASISWRSNLGPFAHYFKVFAPDLPGYGASDKPKIAYSTNFYIEFLGHLMNALGLEKTHLVGFSMGGGIATGFTLQSPQRVDRLVLVNSLGLGKKIPWKVILAKLWRLLFLNNARERVKWSLYNLVSNPQAITEDLIDEVYQLTKKTEAGRPFRSWLMQEIRWSGFRTNFVDQLNQIKVPTLIFHGAEDQLVPVSLAQRAYTLINDAHLYIAYRSGHWPSQEKPDEFNRVVLSFLANKGSRSTSPSSGGTW
jgi:pimeloyl-ACP methyl ester carboxylesterase